MEMRRQDAGLKKPDPWSVVKTWPTPSRGRPGLDDLPKLVWREIYDVAGGIECNVNVHCGALAVALGKNDPRCIRNALDTLKEIGLLSSPDKGYDGDRIVKLHNPWEVRRAWERKMRLVSAANSGQGELEFAEEPESPPEGRGEAPPEVLSLPGANAPPAAKEAGAAFHAHEVPAFHAHETPTSIKHRRSINAQRALSISSAPTKSNSQECQTAFHAHEVPALSKAEWEAMSRVDREAFAKAAAESMSREPKRDDVGAKSISSALAAAVQGWQAKSAGAGVQDAEQLAIVIEKRLADKDFYFGFYKRIAWAVVDGEGGLTFRVVERILDRLDAKCRREAVNRGSYFYAAIQREFRQRYLSLSDRKAPART